MDTKITNKKIENKLTYEKVYNTALELIGEKGFDNVTITEICEKAGIPISSFYNYFKSKDALVDEVFKGADYFFATVVEKNLKGRTAHDKIIRFFYYYSELNKAKDINYIKQLYAISDNLFTTRGKYMHSLLQTIVKEGQEKGEITNKMRASDIVDYLFLQVRDGVYHWCLHDGDYDLTEFTDRYIKHLLKTL